MGQDAHALQTVTPSYRSLSIDQRSATSLSLSPSPVPGTPTFQQDFSRMKYRLSFFRFGFPVPEFHKPSAGTSVNSSAGGDD